MAKKSWHPCKARGKGERQREEPELPGRGRRAGAQRGAFSSPGVAEGRAAGRVRRLPLRCWEVQRGRAAAAGRARAVRSHVAGQVGGRHRGARPCTHGHTWAGGCRGGEQAAWPHMGHRQQPAARASPAATGSPRERSARLGQTCAERRSPPRVTLVTAVPAASLTSVSSWSCALATAHAAGTERLPARPRAWPLPSGGVHTAEVATL